MSNEILLSLNSSNIVANTNNNTLQIQSVSGGFDLRNAEMSCKLAVVNYSFPSFTAAASFSYTWIDGTVHTVAIPANTTFDISDLNSLLVSVYLSNGHYLVNASSQNVYYTQIYSNPNYYSATIQAIPFPTSLPEGYSNPNAISFPGVATYVLLNIANNEVVEVTGFQPGSYPPAQTPASTNYSSNSQLAPQVNPYAAVQIVSPQLSGVNNNPQNLLASFPINVAYGQPLVYQPTYPSWVATVSNIQQTLTFVLTDELSNPLVILDPYMVLTVVIRQKQPQGTGGVLDLKGVK